MAKLLKIKKEFLNAETLQKYGFKSEFFKGYGLQPDHEIFTKFLEDPNMPGVSIAVGKNYGEMILTGFRNIEQWDLEAFAETIFQMTKDNMLELKE